MDIIKCKTAQHIQQVKDYIGSDYVKVPYLYTNLYKYGVGNANVDVWIDKVFDGINGVYLRYFTCLHFFTKDSNYSNNRFVEFVQNNNFDVIMLEDSFGEQVHSILQSYILTREYTFKYDLNNSEYSNQAEFAIKEDFEEIAELLIQDQIYKDIYTKDTLYIQLLERYNAGYGKCCIIRRDEKIVASLTINGENDKFAIVGSLIVHPEYRKRGFGGIVLKYLCKYVGDKGVECLAFLAEDNTATLELHKKINAYPIGMIYKYRKL